MKPSPIPVAVIEEPIPPQVGPIVKPLDPVPLDNPCPTGKIVSTVYQPLPIAQTDNKTQSVQVKTAGSTTRKRSQIVTFTILAGATFPMAAFGNKWQLLAAPCPVPIRYDMTAGFSTYVPGLGLTIATEADFDRLEFQNPLSVTATFTVFFGWDDLVAYITPTFPVTPVEGWTACTNGASVPLSPYTLPFYFRKGFFYGIKNLTAGNAPVANAQVVYIGKTTFLPDIVQPGGWIEYEASSGQLWNFANFNAYGTGGESSDGIFWSLT